MDPITLALVLVGALWVTDAVSSGLVRAELGGGLSGAFGSSGRKWLERRKTVHARRAKRRSKSKAGRAVNAVFDELGDLGRSFFSGWPEGRRQSHEKRRRRWEAKPPWWKRVFGASEPPSDDEAERCSWTTTPQILAEFGIQKACGAPATDGLFCARHAKEADRTKCIDCGRTLGSNHVCEPERPEHEVWQDPEPIRLRNPKGPAEEEDAPEQATPTEASSTPKRGSNVSDLTTAPAVIAAVEAIHDRFENVEADVDELATDARHVADGIGVFATGTEDDAASAVEEALDKLKQAKESIRVALDALHDEWDAHIAASEGGTAEAHSPFQEV